MPVGIHLIQRFRKGLKNALAASRRVDDAIPFVLDAQADIALFRLEDAKLKKAAVPRVKRPHLFLFSVEIRRRWLKPGFPQLLPVQIVSGHAGRGQQGRSVLCRRGGTQTAPRGILTGGGHSFFWRGKPQEIHPTGSGRRRVPLTILVKTLPQRAYQLVKDCAPHDIPRHLSAIVSVGDTVFPSAIPFAKDDFLRQGR